jgi:hypothetical protein
VKTVSCADFYLPEMPEDSWYQLTGHVFDIDDNRYGNFYLINANCALYVYGLKAQKDGADGKFQELAASKGIKYGSVITIIGKKKTYNGQEMVSDAYLVDVKN